MRRLLADQDLVALKQQIARHNQALDAQDAASDRAAMRGGSSLRAPALDGKDVRRARAHGCLVRRTLVSSITLCLAALAGGSSGAAPASHAGPCSCTGPRPSGAIRCPPGWNNVSNLAVRC